MCTAICLKTKNSYFGRTLDLEYNYNEQVVITPRNYSFKMTNGQEIKTHYAIIGTAFVNDNYPLYYDAVNEKGLAMAGLSFPDYAHYNKPKDGLLNIATFEFIPYVLSKFESVKEAKKEIATLNLTDTDFSGTLKCSPLHWIVADKTESITIEQTKDGLKIYDNRAGVLTNNPPFDYQMTNLSNYLNLTNQMPQNRFSDKIELNTYSKGMGAIGLPGDLSSTSRFVRATFNKLNSVSDCDEKSSVSQFFHIMETVSQTKGCVHLGGDKYEITVYTSCSNMDKGIYYYTTYNNRQITAVDMHKEDIDGQDLICYNHLSEENINYQN